jgi:hypothetical protein
VAISTSPISSPRAGFVSFGLFNYLSIYPRSGRFYKNWQGVKFLSVFLFEGLYWSCKRTNKTLIEWMAPPSNDGVHPSHHRILPSSGQAKRVSYTAVQRSSQQLLFPPIEAIYYFKHRLQNLLLCEFNKERCSVLPYL